MRSVLFCFVFNLSSCSRSVAACEELVKKQYSLLGWEYRDGDSDGDDLPGSGKIREIQLKEKHCLNSYRNMSFCEGANFTFLPSL